MHQFFLFSAPSRSLCIKTQFFPLYLRSILRTASRSLLSVPFYQTVFQADTGHDSRLTSLQKRKGTISESVNKQKLVLDISPRVPEERTVACSDIVLALETLQKRVSDLEAGILPSQNLALSSCEKFFQPLKKKFGKKPDHLSAAFSNRTHNTSANICKRTFVLLARDMSKLCTDGDNVLLSPVSNRPYPALPLSVSQHQASFSFLDKSCLTALAKKGSTSVTISAPPSTKASSASTLAPAPKQSMPQSLPCPESMHGLSLL